MNSDLAVQDYLTSHLTPQRSPEARTMHTPAGPDIPPTIAYLGLDVETTGINPHGSPAAGLLELGMIAYTADLQPVAAFSSLVASPVALAHRETGVCDYVDQMHTANGLWEEIDAAAHTEITPEKVQQAALDWMTSSNIPHGLPMLGSSVTLDRNFLAAEMPELLAAFHYRSVDASGLRLAATVTAGVDDAVLCEGHNGTSHRTLDDIQDSADLIRRTLVALAGRS